MSSQKKNNSGVANNVQPLPTLSQTAASTNKKYMTETETETDSAMSDSAFESSVIFID